MATPTIPNGEEYFYPVIYSGNGTGQRVGKFVPFTDNGTIDNSCMFNDGDSAYLDRTFGSGNQKIWTMSFWVKRCTLGTGQRIISRRTGGGSTTATMGFNSSNQFNFYDPSNGGEYITNKTFEDTSKFYHFLIRYEASNGTAGDRLQIYVDGNLQTFGTTGSIADSNGNFNAAVTHAIGKYQYNNSEYLDAYLAEVNWIDGTNYGPETFGVTDTSTGRWIPKTLSGITYGTNGFRLEFGTDSALGDDTSGNTNDFTATNLTASDQRTDTPTNLFPTIRNYHPSYVQTLAEGNLQHSTTGTNQFYPVCSTLRPKGSGKFYAECRISDTPGGYSIQVGCYAQEDLGGYAGGAAYFGNTGFGSGLWIEGTQYLRYNNITTSNVSFTFSAGDVIGVALDLDNGLLSFYDDDNGLIGTTTFDKTKSACFGGVSNKAVTFIWNFGDNPTFNGNETAGGNSDADGNGNFFKSVPSGFKVLTQDNMATTDRGVSGLVWAKSRDSSSLPHQLVDSSRGVGNRLIPNDTNVEAFNANHLSRFLKGGYATGDINVLNTAGDSMVAWNWVANNGTTSTNTDGSIVSTVQANTTAGFSICRWTAPASAGNFGHGLSQAPEWIIGKDLGRAVGWLVYHKDVGTGKVFYLNTNAAPITNSTAYSTAPTATVVDPGTGLTSASSYGEQVYYCWHGVDGFSKFGSYTGNGNADGPFIYTGFRPAWVMVKRTNTTGSWIMWDTKRDAINPMYHRLYANLTNAQGTSGADIDFLSNGFKHRRTDSDQNASGSTYIYMAFAEHPFSGDGTNPVTAR